MAAEALGYKATAPNYRRGVPSTSHDPLMVPWVQIVGAIIIQDARVGAIQGRLVERMAHLLNEDYVRPFNAQDALALLQRQRRRDY